MITCFHEIMEDRVDVFAKIINKTIVDITTINAMVDAIRGCGRVEWCRVHRCIHSVWMGSDKTPL